MSVWLRQPDIAISKHGNLLLGLISSRTARREA
jgi:hypothetical protein